MLVAQDEFDWLEVSNDNETERSLKMKDDPTEYKYGVAVAYGAVKSGVIWVECLHGFNTPTSKGKHSIILRASEISCVNLKWFVYTNIKIFIGVVLFISATL